VVSNIFVATNIISLPAAGSVSKHINKIIIMFVETKIVDVPSKMEVNFEISVKKFIVLIK